jgi:hypothetical protein
MEKVFHLGQEGCVGEPNLAAVAIEVTSLVVKLDRSQGRREALVSRIFSWQDTPLRRGWMKGV